MDDRGLAALADTRADPFPRVDLLEEADDAVVIGCGLPDGEVPPFHALGLGLPEVAVLHDDLVRLEHRAELVGNIVIRRITLGNHHDRSFGFHMGKVDTLLEMTLIRMLMVQWLG